MMSSSTSSNNAGVVKQEDDHIVSTLPAKPVPSVNENDSLAQRQDDETRGDSEAFKREEDASDQREPGAGSTSASSSQPNKKKSSPGQQQQQPPVRSKSNNNSSNNSNNNILNKNGGQLSLQQQHQLQQQYQQRFNNPHPHHNMPGPGPRGPFPMGGRGYGAPPPYGYPGGPGNYPPPPHFQHPHHHHPNHPHAMMGPPYHNGGPYGSGPGGMKGNGFGPMPPYGGGPPGPGPYGMPQYPPPHGMNPNAFLNSNNMNMGQQSSGDSISSKSSMNSKKKRTIDGMHNNNKMPVPYQFRRTESTTSTNSTVTVGNNTSSETHRTDDSNNNMKRSSSHEDGNGSLNMESMMFGNTQGRSQMVHPSFHRRDFSAASTASTLSVGGFSLASYERGNDPMMIDKPMSKNSPKRHKKNTLVVDTAMRPPSVLGHDVEGPESSRFEQLSIDAKNLPSTDSASSGGSNLFLSLSTSPINADCDATPNIKNTAKQDAKAKSDKEAIFKPKDGEKYRPTDTPTPPVHGELGDSEIMHDDHSMLNHHLRGQSFTPLAHLNGGSSGTSPSNAAFAAAIAPQLSWDIAGDTPSLGDLAEWEDEHTNGKLKADPKNRPSSTTSTETRNMTISPHDFQLWKEEHDLADRAMSGTTTPLPVFFEQSGNEGSENNQNRFNNNNHSKQHEMRHSDQMNHQMLMGNNGRFWAKQDGGMGMPPTPMFAGSEFRDDGFHHGHSPMHGDRRDGMDYNYPFPHPHGPNDRIRNLRGRVPPGAHLPPMPLHIPPHMSAHLPMTSPMGLGPKGGMWSPHHGMGAHLGSPHHMGSPLSSMAQSKRKCLPLKPPIPSKFQGDMEKVKSAPVPEFTSLVNFPAHMSQKQAVNLPEGMRCCVMCGQACPCSTGNKNGKKCNGKPGCKDDGGLAPRNNNGQDHLGDKNSGYAIIPTQNKGLCTLCDVNVWVVANSGLEIKWCKGCKNFRPWAAFGDKGLATKCLRCRERQREKYALQKEEKEKARLVAKAKK